VPPGTLLAAAGPVVGDPAVADHGARPGLDGQAAPQPVAAVAACAALTADGLVMVERGVAQRQSRMVRRIVGGTDVDAAAQAVAAVACGAPGTADGLVADDGRADVERRRVAASEDAGCSAVPGSPACTGLGAPAAA